MVSHTTDGKQVSWKRDVPANQACGHKMAAQCAHLISLLHRQDAGCIRSGLQFRRYLVRAGRFDDEVRACTGSAARRITSSGPQPVCGPCCELSHAQDKVVALDVRIKCMSRTDTQ